MATILFVDNDRDFAMGRVQKLQNEGYSVIFAKSPEEALVVLERETVDLLITDLRLRADNDEFDWSGLTLVRKSGLPAKRKILISSDFPEPVRNQTTDFCELLDNKLAGPQAMLDMVAKLLKA